MLRPLASITATKHGFALSPRSAREVVVLAVFNEGGLMHVRDLFSGVHGIIKITELVGSGKSKS